MRHLADDFSFFRPTAVSLVPALLAFILKNGGGRTGLRRLFDHLLGTSEANDMMAEMMVEQSASFPFMNQKN